MLKLQAKNTDNDFSGSTIVKNPKLDLHSVTSRRWPWISAEIGFPIKSYWSESKKSSRNPDKKTLTTNCESLGDNAE